jgi:hypothetical protein
MSMATTCWVLAGYLRDFHLSLNSLQPKSRKDHGKPVPRELNTRFGNAVLPAKPTDAFDAGADMLHGVHPVQHGKEQGIAGNTLDAEVCLGHAGRQLAKADDLSRIRDPDQNHPAGGIGKCTYLPPEIRGAGALKLGGETFAHGEEVIEVFLLHSATNPLSHLFAAAMCNISTNCIGVIFDVLSTKVINRYRVLGKITSIILIISASTSDHAYHPRAVLYP